jgi:acyl-CoA synthetase (AMP-forming)/AMP-acid ligase II
MNIASILAQHARDRPDAPALIHHRIATFAQLDAAATRFARLLQEKSVQPGHSALVLVPMSIHLYAVLIACFRLRVTALFLDPSFGRDYMHRYLAIQAPDVFIGSWKAHLLRAVSGPLRRVPRSVLVTGGTLPADSAPTRVEPCDPDTPALLTFTSGSTGQPKAALRTHAFLLAQNRVLQRTLDLRPGAIDMPALPVFVLANLAAGVTSVIPQADLRAPGRIDPLPVIRQIQTHRVRSLVAAPAFLQRLLLPRQTLPLERIFTGGAPVFPRLLDQLQTLCPSARITAVYGSTEAEPIAEFTRDAITPQDLDAMHRGSGLLAGTPVEEIQLRILRASWGSPLPAMSHPEFAALLPPPGEPGEIVVSGDHVLPGYFRGEGDQETKFRVDGRVWHRTGDLGRLDPQGRIWLLGRASARIQDGRGTLYPFAVEAAVSAFDNVRRSALVTVDGRRILVLDADAEPPNLRGSLAWAQLDETVRRPIPVDPRHNSKVNYPALLQQLQKR